MNLTCFYLCTRKQPLQLPLQTASEYIDDNDILRRQWKSFTTIFNVSITTSDVFFGNQLQNQCVQNGIIQLSLPYQFLLGQVLCSPHGRGSNMTLRGAGYNSSMIVLAWKNISCFFWMQTQSLNRGCKLVSQWKPPEGQKLGSVCFSEQQGTVQVLLFWKPFSPHAGCPAKRNPFEYFGNHIGPHINYGYRNAEDSLTNGTRWNLFFHHHMVSTECHFVSQGNSSSLKNK